MHALGYDGRNEWCQTCSPEFEAPSNPKAIYHLSRFREYIFCHGRTAWPKGSQHGDIGISLNDLLVEIYGHYSPDDPVYMNREGVFCEACASDKSPDYTPPSGMPSYQEGLVCNVHDRIFMFLDMRPDRERVLGVTWEEYVRRSKASWEEYLQSKK